MTLIIIHIIYSFTTYHGICNKSKTTGATSGAGTAHPSVAPEFTLGFSGVGVTRSSVFCVAFYRSLFVLFLLTTVLSVLLRFMD